MRSLPGEQDKAALSAQGRSMSGAANASKTSGDTNSAHPEDLSVQPSLQMFQPQTIEVSFLGEHWNHKVVPVEQAVSDLKDQLKSDLKPVQDKRDKYEEVEKTYNEMIEHSKKQLLSTEKQIRAEFNKLHKFLKEEENYKPTQTRARAQSSLSDPQLVSGALIDEVHFSPVILDPNTADPRLYLPDDLTSVRLGDTKQLPGNPERHTKYPTVLGSEGFSSGKHSWEVEVGDHPDWYVGLAKESADRKRACPASPDSGIWCLEYRRGKYTDGSGRTVTEKKSLQKIRVKLNYERGELSFHDSEDKIHIYTHRDTFTEKLFPYFSIGDSGDAKTTDIKICQPEISLSYSGDMSV
ncbi:nuclear factor 7, brain-like [Scomber scombrus]|uniref:nuclear factor 7, brain-like n=1 Tax=Scomber scombrus TaxID=13677 RepID=UPI002DD9050F|nr:nuclear factor 7, brain-like [Scomber scombrus]